MTATLRTFLIQCWKAELQAAEAAVDRITRLGHFAKSAGYARQAASETARTDMRVARLAYRLRHES
jgi:hypothetical protein